MSETAGPDRFSATFACSFETADRQALELELELVGTAASAIMERPFIPGPEDTGFDVVHRGGRRERVEPGAGDPYRGLVDHVAAVLRNSGDLRYPPAASVELLTVVDRLREAAAEAGT